MRNEFSAPKRANEFYPTPEPWARAGLSLLLGLPERALILDPGAGEGIWGTLARELYPKAYICGVEYRPTVKPEAYDDWFVENYLRNSYTEFDAVIGNPPFSLAEQWVHHSLAAVHDGGIVLLLLRLAFLESEKRGRRFWPIVGKPANVTVFSKRPSFTGDGGTDATAYGMFFWRKGSRSLGTLDIMDANFKLIL
jgi:hypothetical protein